MSGKALLIAKWGGEVGVEGMVKGGEENLVSKKRSKRRETEGYGKGDCEKKLVRKLKRNKTNTTIVTKKGKTDIKGEGERQRERVNGNGCRIIRRTEGS